MDPIASEGELKGARFFKLRNQADIDRAIDATLQEKSKVAKSIEISKEIDLRSKDDQSKSDRSGR
jgi:hypothetical protein